ncbi:MAG: helix-turn-helix domain-containing protein [Gemmatimonadota bacterium]|nr:helix-turn-helix domain-containing protein [Gemmatimonadota bacterium]MDE3172949.1 helix-turn-helix domain-containing protein [Gemmatimonadota bacterium]MDE3216656.1 helix-turn-helix domain-containing protein [Gemmatimonadota bacterium]
MDVVALLPRHLLTHLTRVLGSGHTLTAPADWVELRTTVQRRPVDVVVADPALDGHVQTSELAEIRELFPSLPIVLYTTLSAAAMQGVIQMARYGIEHVVLARFDDEPQRFLELLEAVPGHVLGGRMLRALHDPIAGLPVPISRAIEQLFRAPGRFHGAQDLAEASGTTVRGLYRHMAAVGMPSVRALVVSARLVRTYGYLRDPGRSVKEIAARVGYTRPWLLTKQMREYTGFVPSEVRTALSPDEFIALLATRVRTEQLNEEVG